MLVQLPTGKTISISAYEYYFLLQDSDVDEFFQNCLADDIGLEIENPFATGAMQAKIVNEDSPIIEELDNEEITEDF